MHSCVSRFTARILAVVSVTLVPTALFAQIGPAGKGTPGGYVLPSKFDVFLGYSYLHPVGTVDTLNPNLTPVSASYDDVLFGGVGSFAYFFGRHFGLQAEVGVHQWNNNNDGFTTLAGGPIVRFPVHNFTPFIHALGGRSLVGGPIHEPFVWGPNFTGGGGLDIETPVWNHRLAIRLFQLDYEYMSADWGTGIWRGSADINALRVAGGFVIHGGPMPPPTPLTLACSANPEAVYPGDPTTVTATAGVVNPKDNVIYGWSGTGVSGNGNTAAVNTASLAPGEYSIQGTAKEGKPGKEGSKPWLNATCTAGLTVKAYEPPTISCSVNPTTIKPGDTATITSVGVSPQNRPLTYHYSATGGSVSGTGATAEYSSAGAPTGTVGITCYVSDDKGQTASSQASLTVAAPYVPPAPKTQSLCTLSFAKDKRRPMRVDNEAKACLDQVALDLKQQADAKAVMVGEQTADETAKTAQQQEAATKRKNVTVDQFAAQRAVNAKNYLVTEQGIDPSRISVATGSTGGQTVENYLVPVGANFSSDVTGTTPVDESTIKPQERKPLGQRQ
jgi:hypothetical protein